MVWKTVSLCFLEKRVLSSETVQMRFPFVERKYTIESPELRMYSQLVYKRYRKNSFRRTKTRLHVISFTNEMTDDSIFTSSFLCSSIFSR